LNNVSLIGALIADPELEVRHDGRVRCAMHIEVPRRARGGQREPGVIYVEVSAFEEQARECARDLSAGMRVGISGTLERDDALDAVGPRRSRWEVHAHQVELLDAVSADEF
jgi:single-stranded DNA-binding protein